MIHDVKQQVAYFRQLAQFKLEQYIKQQANETTPKCDMKFGVEK
jgi:hypothetical protein